LVAGPTVQLRGVAHAINPERLQQSVRQVLEQVLETHGSELIVNGVVSGAGFNKFGGGTMEFGGTASNSFANTSIVWEGMLELNKTGGAQAINMADNTELYDTMHPGAPAGMA